MFPRRLLDKSSVLAHRNRPKRSQLSEFVQSRAGILHLESFVTSEAVVAILFEHQEDTMLPIERLAYSAIKDRPRLVLPENARLVVWVIINVEEWNPRETMPRTVLPPPAGGSPEPDIPNWAWHEYGISGSREPPRSEEHTAELQSHSELVCRLLLEKK